MSRDMRLSAALALLVVSGCQCFSPVMEDPDGGAIDAGRDAGVVAPECTTSSQCATTGVTPPCWNATPLRSCFDGRCVYDCGSQPRVCTTSNGTCLTCDGGSNQCAAGCSGIQNGETGRISRHCGGDAGMSTLLGGYSVRYAQGATCNFVFTTDAGLSGTLDMHGGNDTSVGSVSDEPGINCTVTGLATALNRTLIGCSQCIYLLESP